MCASLRHGGNVPSLRHVPSEEIMCGSLATCVRHAHLRDCHKCAALPQVSCQKKRIFVSKKKRMCFVSASQRRSTCEAILDGSKKTLGQLLEDPIEGPRS